MQTQNLCVFTEVVSSLNILKLSIAKSQEITEKSPQIKLANTTQSKTIRRPPYLYRMYVYIYIDIIYLVIPAHTNIFIT